MKYLGKKASIQILVKNHSKLSKSKRKKNQTIKGPWLYKEDMLLKNG